MTDRKENQNREEKGKPAFEEERTFSQTAECRQPRSNYLLACEADDAQELQKELLYEILGPVFFGRKEAGSTEELAALFRNRYGIDVAQDFYEGDEHYEEYLEASQALSEGMSIYGGSILFVESALAELAGVLWESLERRDKKRFRRINTLLEE